MTGSVMPLLRRRRYDFSAGFSPVPIEPLRCAAVRELDPARQRAIGASIRYRRPRGNLMAGAVAAIAGSATVLASADAGATTCNPVTPERVTVSFAEVTRDDGARDDPFGLDKFNTLIQSAEFEDELGFCGPIVLDPKGWCGDFEFDEAITPSPTAQAYIDNWQSQRNNGLFCDDIPYALIRPGIYLPEADGNSARRWQESPFEDPLLTVDADRKTVTFEFESEGTHWTSVYDVEGGRFESGCGGCSTHRRASAGPVILFGLLWLSRRRRTAVSRWRRRP